RRAAPQAGAGLDLDILIVDGGSSDETVDIARRYGVPVIRAEKGRGAQLKAGGRAATGDWLMFLHADTRLTAGWAAAVHGFAADPDNRERAAVFAFALDDDHPAARRIERLAAARCSLLGLPYGDQGLVIARPFYERLGGYKEMPLMEDVDMVRRIGRRRLMTLGAKAVTSARRYREGGYWRRPLFHLLCLSLYFLGVSPKRLAALYG
ncbi:MAG: TIGR04283 family arsenosugar biosynthesis glycosyltransferase, partial [Kiloniellales bacterium]